MKERILTGWTLTRVLYLVMGSYIVAQSVLDQQWVGILLGGYFAAMGLFSFGCAAGNCGVGNYSEGQKNQGSANFEEVAFEEVKPK
ncbi:hypothetical protein [Haliscomenobacter hydrossis]|uniref:Uncharacterized protein n=1 Tax=Haliscomenobacter hydrossis (strain ATCC 27775 / DSM 1100 / LMG 10767 / O) TaxID=760192 RepID=F4KRW5_HALH1|nr:hypothetical protein [Haliscomenobacter hydrossis]AEE50069.1 hypothetical protein Halhy_2186 [Haliscomenobacter hydrossis DSM 1100]